MSTTSNTMQRTAVAAVIAALVAMVVVGCGGGDAQDAAERDRSSERSELDGAFRVEGVEDRPADVAEVVRDDVTELVEAVNDATTLRRDVTIALGGDDDGPFYDPNSRRIEYPWGFFREVRRLLATQEYAGDELDTATRDAALFVLAHEMGHAVIDQRDLPVLGKEEDAADAFASFVAVEVLEQPDQVIGASDLFGAWDQEAAGSDYSDAEFFDSHSLDAQRFFTISCWVYGADPEAHANIVDGLRIDDERLAECEEEWTGIDEDWSELLGDE